MMRNLMQYRSNMSIHLGMDDCTSACGVKFKRWVLCFRGDPTNKWISSGICKKCYAILIAERLLNHQTEVYDYD